MSTTTNPTFVFFGTSDFSVYVLDALFNSGLVPEAVVTFPDKPQGRNLALTPNVVKVWAQDHNVHVIEDQKAVPDADVYIVASYGKILPADIIYKPKAKTLNIHPSLLPRLRGPAPIQEAILHETETGVTIMRLNERMDEGPIVAQEVVPFDPPTGGWPLPYSQVEKILGDVGGNLVAKILNDWVSGTIKETPQDSTFATYTKKIKKEDADITNDTPEVALRKIYAYEVWPRARKGDLIITKAHIENGELVIDSVIPPGKKEMLYSDYMRGHN